MKKINVFIIMIAAIMMMSCDPTERQRGDIVKRYVQQSSFFKVDFVLLSNTYGNSTTDHVCYIIAYDKYEAQRLFDEKISNLEAKCVSSSMQEFCFDKQQRYPYK